MKKGLNGAQLKWIAMITMLIDHIGAILIFRQLDALNINPFEGFSHILVVLYWGCRIIGRFSLVIFVFLLIEGFTKTKNVYRYGLNLLVFALISEIPFNLAVSDTFFDISRQSIMVTLLLGLIMMTFMNNSKLVISVLWIFIFGLLNEHVTNGDYGFYGILLIGGMYLLRKDVSLRNIFVFFIGLYQLNQGLSVFLINLYNGERGKQSKTLNYWFYPVHLVILQIITKLEYIL